jgi:hypothetical protein
LGKYEAERDRWLGHEEARAVQQLSGCKKLGFASLYRQSALRVIRALSTKKVLALH